MKEKILHVVIAPSGWSSDRLKYRHHRLCEFLMQQKETQDVYWTFPAITTFRNQHSFFNAKNTITHYYFKKNKQGIKELALPD